MAVQEDREAAQQPGYRIVRTLTDRMNGRQISSHRFSNAKVRNVGGVERFPSFWGPARKAAIPILLVSPRD